MNETTRVLGIVLGATAFLVLRYLPAGLKARIGLKDGSPMRDEINAVLDTITDAQRKELMEQIVAISKEGTGKIQKLAGYLHDFAYFGAFKKVVLPLLDPAGDYILFVNNIDLLAKYTITVDGVTLTILPCDESTVWKELSDFAGLDKNDFKKLDGGGKVQLILDKATEAKEVYETLSLEDALSRAEPVKNRNENRPV